MGDSIVEREFSDFTFRTFLCHLEIVGYPVIRLVITYPTKTQLITFDALWELTVRTGISRREKGFKLSNTCLAKG